MAKEISNDYRKKVNNETPKVQQQNNQQPAYNSDVSVFPAQSTKSSPELSSSDMNITDLIETPSGSDSEDSGSIQIPILKQTSDVDYNKKNQNLKRAETKLKIV